MISEKGITTDGEVIPNLYSLQPNGNDYGFDLLRLHYQHSHKGHRPGE
jgi:hypothetical protein